MTFDEVFREDLERSLEALKRYHTEQCRFIMGPTVEYSSRPFSPWEGEMVYSEILNQFFQSPEEIIAYIRDKGLEMPENLKLVICEPERWRLLDSNYWYSDAEDFGTDIPKELEEAIEALNRVVRSLPVANWCRGLYRTEMPK